nr:MAG: RNA replication protein [Guangxi alphaflexi-like virus]
MATRLANLAESLTDAGVRASVQQIALQDYTRITKTAKLNNPYSLNADQSLSLENLGITTLPHATDLHTHGAEKAIENRMLEIVGTELPRDEPVAFFFLKPSKLRFLRRGASWPQANRGNKYNQFYNERLEPKDVARYPFDTLLDSGLQTDANVAFMHDVVHYLTPKNLCELFTKHPRLQVVYYTLVLPVEATHRHNSLHPELYSLNYYEDTFHYIPGTHAGGGYVHEYPQLNWLSLNRIETDDEALPHLTLQKLETLGAHHLFIATRGKLLTPKTLIYRVDDMVLLPKIFAPPNANATNPYPRTVVAQLVLYVKSLKAVSERDIYAKIRQLHKTKDLHRLHMPDMVHLANYLLIVASLESVSSYPSLLACNLFKKITIQVRARIDNLLKPIVGASRFDELLKLLDWNNFTYNKTGTTTRVSIANTPLAPRPTTEPEPGLETPGPPATPPPSYENQQDALEAYQLPTCDENSITTEEDTQNGVSLEEPEVEPTTYDEVDDIKPWLGILEAHGFQNQPLQKTADGLLIEPITDVQDTSHYKLTHNLTDPEIQPFTKLINSVKRRICDHEYDAPRAMAYAGDLKNYRTGMLNKKWPKDLLESMTARTETASFKKPLATIHGAGGSGKSHMFQTLLRQPEVRADTWTVITPTTALRNDWVAKIPKTPQHNFKTFEKALTQSCGPVVIVDDYGKLPPGYIDLHMCIHANTQLYILTGDCRQSVYHETNGEAAIHNLASEIDAFQKYSDYYLNITHRNARNFANALKVASTNPDHGVFSVASVIPEGMTVLTPSRTHVDMLADAGHHSMTYAGCQGLTVEKVCLNIEHATTLCSDRVMYTALSRAVNEIVLVNNASQSQSFQDKLNCTPYLKTFLRLTREPEESEDPPTEDGPTEPEPPSTHIPVEECETLIQAETDQMGDKFDREMWTDEHGPTNTVQTDDPLVQAFPHQQAKDEALFWKTIDARLKFAEPEANLRELIDKKDLGDILFENYRQAMSLPPRPMTFDEDMWRAAEAEVTKKYLEKDVRQLMNGAMRQDPDFDTDAIALFLKSQWVKKTEKFAQLKNKPGQTIAAFMQETVMKFGTMARYMRRIQQKYQPSKLYIHGEATPERLNQFVTDHWNFTRDNQTNDFTAYDQSQDGAMLAFETAKARFLGVPDEVVKDYIHIKCHAKVFLGILKIMRLSGEGPTYDANTECNIAYTHTRFFVKPDTSEAYSGDDQALDDILQEKPSWAKIAGRFSLCGKPVVTKKPEFCGWRFTKHGVVKDPKKLYTSLELGRKIGKLHEMVLSYQCDVDYAYKLGDNLHEVFDSDDMRYHYATVRTLHKAGRQPASARNSPRVEKTVTTLTEAVSDRLGPLTTSSNYHKVKQTKRNLHPIMKNTHATGEIQPAQPTMTHASAAWRSTIYPSGVCASESLGGHIVRGN